MSKYAELRTIDVSKLVEKKNNLTYLSWAWAVDQLLLNDPAAVWEYPEPKLWGETVMIFCTVSAFGISRTAQLPVMDYRNKPILNPDAFAVNTAIMRCMTKALSLHGLGLYIYAGEDLPEESKPVIITPAQGIRDELPIEILKYLDELAVELIATCEKDPKAAWVRLEQENLEADQKVALWGLMPSNVRSAIKKAKG